MFLPNALRPQADYFANPSLEQHWGKALEEQHWGQTLKFLRKYMLFFKMLRSIVQANYVERWASGGEALSLHGTRQNSN